MPKVPSCKHLDPKCVQFTVFQPDEIRKLSVARIYIPISFNTLGHPIKGGLYDLALGPVNERGDPCATCLNNVFNCPGHLGHIELPLLAFNPLFYSIIFNILKLACLSCSNMRIPPEAKFLLIAQLTLLDMGYTAEAQECESLIISYVTDTSSMNYDSKSALVKEELENYVSKVLSEVKPIGDTVELSKNIESLRNSYIHEALSKLEKKKCPRCNRKLKKIMLVKNKLMTTVDVGDEEGHTKAKAVVTSILPEEARKYLREIWKQEHDLIKALAPVLKHSTAEFPIDAFFLDVIPVTPSKSRPVDIFRGKIIENPQTAIYKSILEDSSVARNIMKAIQDNGTSELSEEGQLVVEHAQGNTMMEKLHHVWQELQTHVDQLMDASQNMGVGLKQVIEKKGGIIRMHMMGKRVNFAARSVITPDPNLNIDEIGIPEVFAKTLTYPEPVTPWNVSMLRKLVLNGPEVHPGAVMVQNEDGTISKISNDNQVRRESIAKRLLTPEGSSSGYPRRTKIVHRHLQNGDILLLNRQPTLHRPSIMAHKARILKGEKTLRLHYANCKAYNADFDGDEMNAHFPQNELARSEAYNLVNVSHQYLVPKDGTPLCGLIQDHMVSGVRLSIRGRFFTKEDYFGLVFHALPRLCGKVKLLRPAIMKPIALWSGKQIISTVIINIVPKKKNLITLRATSKITNKAWECYPPRVWRAGGTPFSYSLEMSEADVIIRKGELLCGVLDKTHYGATPYGLIHCIYELYGGPCAIDLLSAFAKLFTAFLQVEGFTLGVEDILVVKKADRKRSRIITEGRKIGAEATAAALDLDCPSQEDLENKLSQVYGEDYEKWRAVIDRSYKRYLDSCTNDINQVCLPSGLLEKFPANNLQLMVQSGAKGSTVNTMQISCLLGQIELEGKRPPLMVSGKSLPSFRRFDLSPRAGGYIDGRFMTGIQPQEFFFHCMAGREGLIDTAVKTSRSGYLQRCLVKHLEGLVVHYDGTVRDSDGSVIQFSYGEDGMDVLKVQFMKAQHIPFLVENCAAVIDKKALKTLKAFENDDDYNNLKSIEKRKKRIKKWNKKLNLNVREMRISGKWKRCPDPVTASFAPNQQFGALTERLDELMNDYLVTRSSDSFPEFDVQDMMFMKSMTSCCCPGEPVGLLASQSIGEPSTQMTLNTFHFAGRGEMNVTLGIPRLREILMMASKNIKTPSMDVPFLPNISSVEKKAEYLKKRLRRIVLSDVLEYAAVEDRLSVRPGGMRDRMYTIILQFLPHKAYKSQFLVKPHNILMYVEKCFIFNLLLAIKKLIKFKSDLVFTENETGSLSKQAKDDDLDDSEGNDQASMSKGLEFGEDHISSDEEPEAQDEDATQARVRSRHQEHQEYEEPEEEEIIFDDDDYDEWEEDDDDDKLEIKERSAGAGNKTEENMTELKDMPAERCKKVVASYDFVTDYKYDSKNDLWCEITLTLPLNTKRLDLSTLLKTEAEKAVVWETPAIKKAFTYISPETGALMLKTDGINFSEMFKCHDLLDLNKLYSNDIYRISLTYGIEAARMVIVKEVKDVFKMYGITVDPRHLLLIADYMTFEGSFEPLSRKGMDDSTSPLQQMSFESSLKFLKMATLQGKHDHLRSPSSRIMIGRPCKNGTGLFSMLQKLVLRD